jgi:CubicO group peptidase (beta-lactamase class C family)
VASPNPKKASDFSQRKSFFLKKGFSSVLALNVLKNIDVGSVEIMWIKFNNSDRIGQRITSRSEKKRCSLPVIAKFVLAGWLSLLALLLTACAQGMESVDRQSSLAHSVGMAASKHEAGRVVTQVDSWVSGQVAQQQFSGTVLVAVDKRVVLAKGYGLADHTRLLPNTPDTRFFLGSVTKEFTATAILLLQQQGKLHVQDRLCAYIPNCPSPWQDITIKEVLTHTSGIPAPDDSDLSPVSPETWIASFNALPLEFPPGSQYDYCSTCYQILAYLVQKVSNEPYTRYVQQMILQPLKMTHSGFDPDAYYSQPGGSLGYSNWEVPDDQLGFAMGEQWSFLDGSGLLYSNVNDLFLWDQALYTDVLLPQAVLATAFTPYVDAAELFPGSDYGYGWFITQSPIAGHRLIWHDGAIDGFRNYIGRYVDDHVTIIVLSNLATVDPVAFEQSIQKVVFANL